MLLDAIAEGTKEVAPRIRSNSVLLAAADTAQVKSAVVVKPKPAPKPQPGSLKKFSQAHSWASGGFTPQVRPDKRSLFPTWFVGDSDDDSCGAEDENSRKQAFENSASNVEGLVTLNCGCVARQGTRMNPKQTSGWCRPCDGTDGFECPRKPCAAKKAPEFAGKDATSDSLGTDCQKGKDDADVDSLATVSTAPCKDQAGDSDVQSVSLDITSVVSQYNSVVAVDWQIPS